MGYSKFSLRKRKEFKLSEESATEIMLDFCEKFDIDVDAIEDKKQRRQTENLLNCLLDYIRRGFIEIHDDYSITQHLQNAPGEVIEIKYNRITGEQKLSMDGKDENDRYEMMYAVLGSASRLGESAIRKLSGTDLKVAETLTVAFL